ncbi:MAG: hypothetical protein L3J04_06585 [Robiginitomaculum sp.]|nr:hypothetical protein [Robiginitomaculum sp.]
MRDEQEVIEGELEDTLTAWYLVVSVVVGFTIVGTIAFAGINHWPLMPSLYVGALAQTIFRVAKKMWSNHLECTTDEYSYWANRYTFLAHILAIYGVMIAVSAFWYGLGWGSNWLWLRIF